jgi:hypothetical protein
MSPLEQAPCKEGAGMREKFAPACLSTVREEQQVAAVAVVAAGKDDQAELQTAASKQTMGTGTRVSAAADAGGSPEAWCFGGRGGFDGWKESRGSAAECREARVGRPLGGEGGSGSEGWKSLGRRRSTTKTAAAGLAIRQQKERQ